MNARLRRYYFNIHFDKESYDTKRLNFELIPFSIISKLKYYYHILQNSHIS